MRARGLLSWHGLPQSSQRLHRLFSGPNPRILLLPAARGMFMAENFLRTAVAGHASVRGPYSPCSLPTLAGEGACWLR